VGAEEVEAYAVSGGCDDGGASRAAGQSKCECLREASVRSCVDAGVPEAECRQAVDAALPGFGC